MTYAKKICPFFIYLFFSSLHPVRAVYINSEDALYVNSIHIIGYSTTSVMPSLDALSYNKRLFLFKVTILFSVEKWTKDER